MSRPLPTVSDIVRKMLLSIAAIAIVFLLALRAPQPFTAAPETPLPAEATTSASPASAVSSSSAFLIDDLPLGTESWTLDTCDPATWTPVGSSLWGDRSLLLDLDRSGGRVVALWLEISADETDLDDATAGAHHAAQLQCEGGRGEVTHTWFAAATDLDALRRRLAEPVTERDGPIPLLAGSVELLRFRSLEWAVHLDEPTDPATAVERQHVAMAVRGWKAANLPASEVDNTALADAFAAAGEGSVLTHRDGSLCVVYRVVVDARDLLLTACRGLA